MKNFILALLLVAVMAVPSFAFVSNRVFTGQVDNEYTTGIAGSTILIGEWLCVSIGTQLALATAASGYGDTGVVVNTSPATENYGLVIGVAMNGGDTGDYIRILTRGITLAYVDGSDTNQGAAIDTGIAAGAPLSLTDKRGYAGAAEYVSGATPTGTQAASTVICGYVLKFVDDAATTSRQSVYVICR